MTDHLALEHSLAILRERLQRVHEERAAESEAADRLRLALKRYGDHSAACFLRRGAPDCSCGFELVLADHESIEELDFELLAKLASGEGGRRTGALKRAGFLEWTVTQKGLVALEALRDEHKPEAKP